MQQFLKTNMGKFFFQLRQRCRNRNGHIHDGTHRTDNNSAKNDCPQIQGIFPAQMVLFHGDGKGTDSEEAEEYSRAEALLDIAEDEMKSKLGEENEE